MANVMIIEDSSFMRLILKDIIAKAGHRLVGEAENGLTGVQKYRECQPDLVILNIVMPEMNGIEALRHIREINPRARVIICSAMGNQYSVIEAIKAGAMDFVVKPFDAPRMISAMDRVLHKL
ncbi:response regulator [Paenibacillus sp. GD4]|jgi:two-component system, chemotaxis family, chemotaxis protein CheY|uniref:response regulator n=1 Tax=Paenibacillus sp. GD4 TaxID=3068890 RepID=UPI00279675A9|nr:response regulator [Paenibacillus sp. GD4]MDQ1912057.1 response regulator [Paenibacillus sp. GD4]